MPPVVWCRCMLCMLFALPAEPSLSIHQSRRNKHYGICFQLVPSVQLSWKCYTLSGNRMYILHFHPKNSMRSKWCEMNVHKTRICAKLKTSYDCFVAALKTAIRFMPIQTETTKLHDSDSLANESPPIRQATGDGKRSVMFTISDERFASQYDDNSINRKRIKYVILYLKKKNEGKNNSRTALIQWYCC